MPSARPAAEIEPSRSRASSRSAFPGPIAISPPHMICNLILRVGDLAMAPFYPGFPLCSNGSLPLRSANGNDCCSGLHAGSEAGSAAGLRYGSSESWRLFHRSGNHSTFLSILGNGAFVEAERMERLASAWEAIVKGCDRTHWAGRKFDPDSSRTKCECAGAA